MIPLEVSLNGGQPGGFSRSVVNFDAGAETPAAGAYAAVGIAMATLFLTPAIAYLPQATLAATIIVAVATLIDLPALGRTWRYSRTDFGAMLATIVLTLVHSVEAGIITFLLQLYYMLQCYIYNYSTQLPIKYMFLLPLPRES